MPTQMLLPDERALQIKALATARGITSIDVIGHLINAAIERGELEDTLPGWLIAREGDEVVFAVGESETTRYPLQVARVFAERIRAVMSGELPSLLDLDDDYLITRAGTGFKIGNSTASKPVAPSVAVDIARLLNKAAA
ncbi:hypothetical protein SAMN02745157_0198 [Kaistia soli DSM 19436]|uniref:Uncharacterized protein n=1 Tax=Kaistia soli DSM 19436 TaxID=1122133 RepID=A0A1M5PP61_9HYPH|nr:hypothetical protein [Kaistia soli]SHH03481.1 hypothetical protein SAMN02745157_0198 [Kaistia soli DSM 19436]